MRPPVRLAAIAFLSLAGCGYSPSPASGTLKCGPSLSCPEGYSCADGLTCWKNGETPSDGGPPRDAGGGGRAGSGGAGGGSSGGAGGGGGAAAKFVGTWTFGATLMKAIACSDGSSSTTSVGGDYVDVAAGTTVALTADYYCLWNLDVAATGTSTVLRTGTSCTKTDSTVSPPVTYTFHGQTFTLTTTDGHTGTLDAQLPYDYQSSAGTGTCTMHFTGPLSK
jgi:hypothetical protein